MIYLDSAATSLQKPEGVQYAVISAMNNLASPGRGSHGAAMRASDECFACREAIAKLFNVSQPENVVFTFNATHSLNIAIRSLVSRGDTVLVSGYEHNSVTRPLNAIGAEIIAVKTPLFDTKAFLEEFEKRLPECRDVVCTHVSNVFGYILPVEELARLCRRAGKPFVIDASQSAGVLDIDFQGLGADFIAMPGHKGLLGPQGTGVLLCKNEAKPLLYGGSGSSSRVQTMPEFLPDRLEAGTHNVTGIAGLHAGVNYILRRGTASIRAHERELLELTARRLLDTKVLRLFYCPDERCQSGVLSMLPDEMYCETLGERLAERGIAVRCGLHCAPLAHETAGTLDSGTLRMSFSPFNSAAECAEAADAVIKILKNT